jgi:hypothetical protein
MTTALLIKTDGELSKVTITEGSEGLYELQGYVGGYIDCVRGDDIVGYVNDEGIIMGLEYNLVASSLFQRHLFGDVVVVGAYDKDGVYDGANYDIPSWLGAIVSDNLDTPVR